MKKELEKLWYSYLNETIVERNDKEKEAVNNLTAKDNFLREMLDNEQISALEEYDNAMLKVCNISEKNSFIVGFKFATRIILEALYEE